MQELTVRCKPIKSRNEYLRVLYPEEEEVAEGGGLVDGAVLAPID